MIACSLDLRVLSLYEAAKLFNWVEVEPGTSTMLTRKLQSREHSLHWQVTVYLFPGSLTAWEGETQRVIANTSEMRGRPPKVPWFKLSCQKMSFQKISIVSK